MNNLGVSRLQPDQALDKWTDEDYIKNLRWMAGMYNNALNNIPVLTTGGAVTAAGTTTYIQEYYTNLTYIYGTQGTQNYAFFVRDMSGNDTQTPMARGLDVFKIFNYLHGQATELIDPLPKTVVASAYSKGAVSARKEMMDFISFQIKSKVFLKAIEMESGFGFKVIDKDFQTQEQVDKFFESFQETMEIGYTQMAKDSLYVNDYKIKLPKVFDYMLVGNLGCIRVDYINGKPHWRIVTPDRAITDYTKALDVHLDDDFAGEVFQMTIPELFSTWEFTEEERKNLQSIAQNQGGLYSTYYSTYLSNGLYWWSNQNNVPKVTIVTGQWRSLQKKEDGSYEEVLREGYLIGDIYLRGQKISDDQVNGKKNKHKKRLKYITVTPNLMMGTSISVVGVVKRYQDLKDAFITKMVDMASRAIGRGVIVKGSKLPTGMRTPEFISQLKQAGVIVVEGDDTDDDDGASKDKRMAETIDLTIDPNISTILSIAQYFENVISDVLNVPPTLRGQPTGYVSSKMVDNTQVQSSKGLSYLYKNFLLFVKELVEYSVDIYKNKAAEDEEGREHLELLVGDALVEIFNIEEVKRMAMEDFILTLDVDNYAHEQQKTELKNLVLQIATSGAPRKILKDYLKLDQLETKTEQINYLEAEIYKDEMAERQAQEQQMAMQQYQADLNAQTQRDIAEAGLEGQAMGAMTKLAQDRKAPKPN